MCRQPVQYQPVWLVWPTASAQQGGKKWVQNLQHLHNLQQFESVKSPCLASFACTFPRGGTETETWDSIGDLGRTWRPGGKTDWGPRRTCMHICSSITIFVSFPSRFCCIASHLSGTQKHAVVVIVDAPLNQTQELVPFFSISSHTPAVHTVIIYNKDERKGRRRTRCLAPVDGIFQGARASAAPFA